MRAYLFVHFKEKKTIEGEQVYFAVSTDGFHWEQINGGEPVLWSTEGDQGVRDFTIIRAKNGKFYIMATDLGLANCFESKYQGSWENISRYGSKNLVLWESEDLLHWSEQKMIKLGDEDFGCLWAPDIIYDQEKDDYVVHWSSSHSSNDYGFKRIYYSRTKDFEHFTKPALLCGKEDSGIIDSAIYHSKGMYYCFLKSEKNPAGIILEKAKTLTGEYIRVEAFDKEIAKLNNSGAYEAPTAFQMEDGRWCLMLDFFGCKTEEQGYVPFVAEDIDTGLFLRSDDSFEFPYGFKHGTIMAITLDEYEKLKSWK